MFFKKFLLCVLIFTHRILLHPFLVQQYYGTSEYLAAVFLHWFLRVSWRSIAMCRQTFYYFAKCNKLLPIRAYPTCAHLQYTLDWVNSDGICRRLPHNQLQDACTHLEIYLIVFRSPRLCLHCIQFAKGSHSLAQTILQIDEDLSSGRAQIHKIRKEDLDKLTHMTTIPPLVRFLP